MRITASARRRIDWGGPIWTLKRSASFGSIPSAVRFIGWIPSAASGRISPYPRRSDRCRCAVRAVPSCRCRMASIATSFATGVTEPFALLGLDHPHVRLNDGKTDRQGRFVAGTMHLHRAEDEPVVGGLFRLNPEGTVELLVEDIATSNGPCFSPDGRILYFADSTRQTIWAFDYDPLSGTPSERRVFADLRPLGTAPDGATVDAEGYVWSVLIRTSTIARFDPAGRMVSHFMFPVRYPTSVAWRPRSGRALCDLDLPKPALRGSGGGCRRAFRRRGSWRSWPVGPRATCELAVGAPPEPTAAGPLAVLFVLPVGRRVAAFCEPLNVSSSSAAASPVEPGTHVAGIGIHRFRSRHGGATAAVRRCGEASVHWG